jgi:hypothetical protein
MVDPGDQTAAAGALAAGLTNVRALLANLPECHRVVLPRDYRRRATPSRSARTTDLTISFAPGGAWLDVAGKAGILFTADQWAQFTAEALALLLELVAVAAP